LQSAFNEKVLAVASTLEMVTVVAGFFVSSVKTTLDEPSVMSARAGVPEKLYVPAAGSLELSVLPVTTYTRPEPGAASVPRATDMSIGGLGHEDEEEEEDEAPPELEEDDDDVDDDEEDEEEDEDEDE